MVENDGVYGTNGTGNWTGMIGMAARNEVDLSIADFRATSERSNVVGFTPHLMQFRLTNTSSKHSYPVAGSAPKRVLKF